MGMLEGAGYLAQFFREQWNNPDKLAAIQEQRLGKALEDAYKAGYYRNLLDSVRISPFGGAESLRELPVTTKEAVQAQPESFLPKGYPDRIGIVHETTGSTGKPLRVWMDKKSATMRTSLLLFNLLSCGITPFSLTAHLVFPDSENKLGRGRALGILPWLSLDILDDEEKNLGIIRKCKADSVGYYPSATTLLARVNMESDKPVKLGRVLSGSELLTPDWRKLLEESFSCPAFNLYGSWEFGPMAWECPEEHSMHVNTGSFFMEILDERGRPCEKGPGRVVLTSLCNSAMPLLRYDMGDLASWGGQCPCGRGLPVIKSLEGRADDMVILPSGRLRSPLSFRFTDLECVAKEVLMYQLVQEKEDLFVFRYVPSKAGLADASKKDIEHRISIGCGGEPVKVEFVQAEEIKRNRGGKLDRLVSNVSRQRSVRKGGGPS